MEFTQLVNKKRTNSSVNEKYRNLYITGGKYDRKETQEFCLKFISFLRKKPLSAVNFIGVDKKKWPAIFQNLYISFVQT